MGDWASTRTEPVRDGSRLRDAAVEPHPDDHLAPTNAGKADPHGPEVVSPGIDGPATPLQPGEGDDAAKKALTDGERPSKQHKAAAKSAKGAKRK